MYTLNIQVFSIKTAKQGANYAVKTASQKILANK